MRKMNLRIISMMLSLVMLAGMIYIPAGAASEDLIQADKNSVTAQGNNSLGDLVANQMTQSMDAAEGITGGYDIGDVTVIGNTATVEYVALEDAWVVVSIRTPHSSEVQARGRQLASAAQKTVEVILEGEMPEYFQVDVYMLSTVDFAPLCPMFSSSFYTYEIQQLLASTVDDYDPDRVLRLDVSKDNNFAVYHSGVIRIPYEEGKNVVVSADEEKGIYVIEHATDAIKNLDWGSIFSYEYGEGEILIVKVGDISVSGDTVTITAGELEMDDVFSHVKIDTSADTSDVEMDTSNAAQGVTYLEKNECTAYGKSGQVEEESLAKKLELNYDETLLGDDDAKVQFKASFEISLTASAAMLKADDYLWMKLEFTIGAEGTIGVTGAIGCKVPVGLAKFGLLGIVEMGIDVNLVAKFSGSISAKASYEVKFGFIIEVADGDPLSDGFYDPGEPELKTEVSGKAFLGFAVTPNVKLVGGILAYGELKAELGCEVSLKKSETEDSEDVLHNCKTCFGGDVSFVFEFTYEVKLLKAENITFTDTLFDLKYKLTDVYLSLDSFAFGFSKCPNISYKTKVLLVDQEGVPIPNVMISAGVETAVTNADGMVEFVLKPDKYVFMASVGEEMALYTTCVQSPCTIKLKVGTNYTGQFDGFDDPIGNIVDSMNMGTCGDLVWILMDGVLSIIGEGDMPDYMFNPYYEEGAAPWYQAQAGIKKAVITDGVTSIGSCAFAMCQSIEEVEIADTVTRIGEYAFWGTNLKTVDLPANLETVGELAFSDVADLGTITIESSNANYYVAGNCLISNDGTLVFGCKNSVIPDDGSVKVIGVGAFEGSNITSIVIPDSVTEIRIWAFGGCGFAEHLSIGAGVKNIAGGAFVCSEIYSSFSPGADRYAGFGSYTGLHGGNYKTVISVSADNPNYYSAGDCVIERSTKTVILGCNDSVIPNDGSVLAIGDLAFYASVPRTLIIPEGVTRIGEFAFADSAGASTVVVAASVKEIDHYAFGDTGISDFVFKGDAPEMEDQIFGGWPGFVSRLYYPQGNSTWTQEVMDWITDGLRYSSEWIPYEPGTMPIEIPTSSAPNSYAPLSRNNAPVMTAPQKKDAVSTLGFIGGDIWEEDEWDYIQHYAQFNDLVVGAEYLLLVLASVDTEDPLAPGNILHMEQAKADQWGELYFAYTVAQELDPMYVILCGPSYLTIEDAEVIFAGEYDGQTHIVDPQVIYDGKLLEEGKDYILMGDVMYRDAGEYTYDVVGIGNYSGVVTRTYTIENIVASGECGSNLTWTLDGDGILTISGEGRMYDYGANGMGDPAPWNDYAEQITSLHIADTVTSIGHEAFAGCTALTTLDMPAGVDTVGYRAFADCTGLTTLIIGADSAWKWAYQNVFENCTALADIYLSNQMLAEKMSMSWCDSMHLLDHAQRVYVPSSLEVVSETITLYFACTNPVETVEVEGVSYDLYTRGTHAYETSIKAPTCTEDGTLVYLCGNCGHTYEQWNAPAAGHDWNEFYICRTCGEAPDYILECGLEVEALTLVDGVYYTADGHPVVIAVAAPLDYWLAGESLKAYVDMYGSMMFSMTYWEDLLANMNEDGFVPLTEESLVWILDVICSPGWGGDAGELTYYLAIHVMRDQICAHQYESVVTAPSCTQQGYTTHTCALCGDSYVDNYTDALGHSAVTDGAVAPTCTQSGLTEGSHCERCGEILVAQETVDALGHDYDLTDSKAPTCTEDGYNTYTCNHDGSHTYTETVEAIGHNYIGVVTAPNCTEDGYTTYTCEHCADTYTADVVAALGHSYEETVVEPTCTEEGSITHTCTTCGDTYTEKLEKLPHSYENGVCQHCGASEVLLGDVNGDGNVNSRDARLLLRYLAGLIGEEDLNLAAANFNGDSSVNVRDARAILRYIAGLE